MQKFTDTPEGIAKALRLLSIATTLNDHADELKALAFFRRACEADIRAVLRFLNAIDEGGWEEIIPEGGA